MRALIFFIPFLMASNWAPEGKINSGSVDFVYTISREQCQAAEKDVCFDISEHGGLSKVVEQGGRKVAVLDPVKKAAKDQENANRESKKAERAQAASRLKSLMDADIDEKTTVDDLKVILKDLIKAVK